MVSQIMSLYCKPVVWFYSQSSHISGISGLKYFWNILNFVTSGLSEMIVCFMLTNNVSKSINLILILAHNCMCTKCRNYSYYLCTWYADDPNIVSKTEGWVNHSSKILRFVWWGQHIASRKKYLILWSSF